MFAKLFEINRSNFTNLHCAHIIVNYGDFFLLFQDLWQIECNHNFALVVFNNVCVCSILIKVKHPNGDKFMCQ